MVNTETEWLQSALKGNTEAFAHLIDTYQVPVYNLCYRMLGDTGEAEDAAQECFWRAYQSLKRYNPERSFTTWLLSIAAHYCIDQLRKRHLVVTSLEMIPEETAPDQSTPNPESVYSHREEQQNLQKLLASLNPQDRAAIIMRYWYDFSDEEIGAATSLTVSAVKSRLHRARRELAVLWQSQLAPTATAQRRKHESPAF